MEFKKYFNYEAQLISIDIIYKINPSILNELYVKEDEHYINNVYFKLLNQFIYLENNKFYKEAAYVSYLIAYWVFVLYTPANSEEIALYYINKSIEYDKNNFIYTDYLKWIEKGN